MIGGAKAAYCAVRMVARIWRSSRAGCAIVGTSRSTRFDWLGTDQDQNDGDRIFAPFAGAHFGWGHPWSAHWTGKDRLPTEPISGSAFVGSGTGILWADVPGWPATHRGVFLFNDWLLKKTHVYRPRWEGALRLPEGDPYRMPRRS